MNNSSSDANYKYANQQAVDHINMLKKAIRLADASLWPPLPESPATRAHRIAAEVRARHPEMQVRKVT